MGDTTRDIFGITELIFYQLLVYGRIYRIFVRLTDTVSMNLYIGNLDYKVNENHLREFFEQMGEVSSAKIITDRDTGRSKGFGFVEMPNNDEANAAIESLNGKNLLSRAITVNEARPRPEGGNDRRRY